MLLDTATDALVPATLFDWRRIYEEHLMGSREPPGILVFN